MDCGKDLSGDNLGGAPRLEENICVAPSPAEEGEGLLRPLELLPGEVEAVLIAVSCFILILTVGQLILVLWTLLEKRVKTWGPGRSMDFNSNDDKSGSRLNEGGSRLEEEIGVDAEGDVRPFNPLEIFPCEIWLEVFKSLEYPRDLLHVVDTHPVFEEILELGKGDVPAAGRGVYQVVEVLPLVLKWLRKTDILSLRQVCKRVSLTVDKVVEENPRINPYEHFGLFPWLTPPFPQYSYERMTYEHRNIKLPSEICPFVTLDSLPKINEVSQQLEMEKKRKRGGRRLKIVGGKVRIRMRLVEDELPNENAVTMVHVRHVAVIIISVDQLSSLLITLSGFVRFVDFSLLELLMNQHDVYSLLHATIEVITNLHRVEISSILPEGPIVIRRDFREQRHFIIDYPLPSCPTLESISIMEFTCPGIIMWEIANRYGDHLKELSLELFNLPEFGPVEFDEDGEQNEQQQQPYQFPALLQLNLMLVNFPGSTFPHLDAPNLRSLVTHILDNDPHRHPLEALGLIFFLKNYPLLLDLDLSLSAHDVDDISISAETYRMIREHRWELQTLRHLKINIRHGRMCSIPLHFFPRVCPNLESITVNDGGNGRTPDDDLDLLRRGRMHYSWIWAESYSLQMMKRVPEVGPEYICFRPAVLGPDMDAID